MKGRTDTMSKNNDQYTAGQVGQKTEKDEAEKLSWDDLFSKEE